MTVMSLETRICFLFLLSCYCSSQNVTNSNSSQLIRHTRQVSNCRTWDGRNGKCDSIQNCPQLVLNLSALRNSFCTLSSVYFFNIYGVCCPLTSSVTAPPPTPPSISVTSRPFTRPKIVTNTKKTVSTTTTKKPTTRRTTKKTTKQPIKKLTTKIPSVNSPPSSNDFDDINTICGQSNTVTTRIVGGIEAQEGAYPWVAAIFLTNRRGFGRTEFWCGGVVIDHHHVMTAAHCFHSKRGVKYTASQLKVVLGDHHIYRTTDRSEPIEYKVTEIRSHPKFSRLGFYNDVSLLRLDKRIEFTEFIQPACLPHPKTIPKTFLGLRGTVTGWGTLYYGGPESGSLQEVDVPIWRNEDCNRVYKQEITDTFVCAGYADGGQDSCQGDSGSPMAIINKNGQWTIIGVVSFGTKCAQPGYPGVYTRITEYIEWIKENRLKTS